MYLRYVQASKSNTITSLDQLRLDDVPPEEMVSETIPAIIRLLKDALTKGGISEEQFCNHMKEVGRLKKEAEALVLLKRPAAARSIPKKQKHPIKRRVPEEALGSANKIVRLEVVHQEDSEVAKYKSLAASAHETGLFLTPGDGTDRPRDGLVEGAVGGQRSWSFAGTGSRVRGRRQSGCR